MPYLHCERVERQEELDMVARLRWAVLGEEEGILHRFSPDTGREWGPLDTLSTTRHLLTRVVQDPAGTARLLLANPQVAAANGFRFGFAMEVSYRIVSGPCPGHQLAEVSRVCVPLRWQGIVTPTLFAGICRESLGLGITHLLTATTLETDSPEVAARAYRAARDQGVLSEDWHVEPRAAPAAVPSSLRSHRSPVTPRQIHSEQALPPKVSMLIDRGAARIAGEPVWDSYMSRYSIPLVIELGTLPAVTTLMFKRLWRR